MPCASRVRNETISLWYLHGFCVRKLVRGKCIRRRMRTFEKLSCLDISGIETQGDMYSQCDRHRIGMNVFFGYFRSSDLIVEMSRVGMCDDRDCIMIKVQFFVLPTSF